MTDYRRRVMPYRSRSILIGVFALHCAMVALGQTSIVIPNANATTAGNGGGTLPATPTSGEIQNLFDPSQFPSWPIYITGITFRAAPGQGAYGLAVSGSA